MCSCPVCASLRVKCPDGWCARCGACLPGASWENMDICATCEAAMKKEKEADDQESGDERNL